MSDYVCFLGAVVRCEGLLVFGKFVREDGQTLDLQLPLSAFNVSPPPATVIIAKARLSGPGSVAQLDIKFRAATLEEVKFLDRVEMPEAMNWIRKATI
jgi:hypothetical protein